MISLCVDQSVSSVPMEAHVTASPIPTQAPFDRRAAPSRRGARRRALALVGVAGVVLAAAAVPRMAQAAPPAAGAEWRTSAGTVQGTRFSALNQINRTNVSRLTQ
jgi:glucose dehydrogenase